MTNTQPVELNRRNLQNGHVVITYKKDGLIFYDEYLSPADATEQNKSALVSRAYAKRNKLGRNMLIYIDINKNQTPPAVLKVLTYDKQNKLSEEIVYDKNEKKTLSRFYVDGHLDQDWTYDPDTGLLTLGVQYQKNSKGRYDIMSVSTPIYAPNGELSHTIQKKTTPSGEPTGEVLQRVFYLCNLPFVKVTYTENPTDPRRPISKIYSLDNGQWTLVTDEMSARTTCSNPVSAKVGLISLDEYNFLTPKFISFCNKQNISFSVIIDASRYLPNSSFVFSNRVC